MNKQQLETIAQAMVAKGKGILAMDESTGTSTKQFTALGIESTAEKRRAYRSMLLTTPNLSDFIAGAILYDETIRQQIVGSDTPMPTYMAENGIIPGIKMDTGAHPLAGHPNEKVTEGLDGLRERLAEYAAMGARFTKWRAVITIGNGLPTRGCIEANAHALARYAALAQEAGLVPIVEPEVLINGDHSIERCYEVTAVILQTVFQELFYQGVHLEGIILKPSMVIAGQDCPQQASPEQVPAETVRCLRNGVPTAVPGIAFLSGGQTAAQATQHLSLMNQLGSLPWALTFSYGRALQGEALQTWRGNEANNQAAQAALYQRAKLVGAASIGQYAPEME
ncbi:Fructose-bisphosphate aldolase class I [hydrothermal vent metagenome]|uniref:fructose-bisphosphate aldolase n=1 Tax=hydrothermal vent metagenome TaxID=652676 RepID=A0A3B0VRN6_9ZZZZ